MTICLKNSKSLAKMSWNLEKRKLVRQTVLAELLRRHLMAARPNSNAPKATLPPPNNNSAKLLNSFPLLSTTKDV